MISNISKIISLPNSSRSFDIDDPVLTKSMHIAGLRQQMNEAVYQNNIQNLRISDPYLTKLRQMSYFTTKMAPVVIPKMDNLPLFVLNQKRAVFASRFHSRRCFFTPLKKILILLIRQNSTLWSEFL